MSDRFADARLKVARAKEHLADLQGRIKVWVGQNPIGLVDDHDRQTGWHILRGKQVPDGPREWAPLIGDWAQNLRTALNYALIQLVEANHGTPCKSNQFPIYSVQPDRKRYRAMIRGVGQGAAQIIENLQPYLRPKRTEPELLEVLADLSNVDRHSGPHLAAMLTAPFSERFVKVTPLTSAYVREVGVPATVGESVSGTGVWAIRLDPPDTKIQVELMSHIPVDMAFGSGRTAIPTGRLPNVVQEVERVLILLEPFAP